MASSSSLNQISFNYPGCEHDRAAAEKIFVEHSVYDMLMQEKLVAMKTKQRLHDGQDRAQFPPLHALDSTTFSYKGWQSDKEEAEKRLVGDCSVMQLGSYQVVYNKMQKKQSLISEDRSSNACLKDLDEANEQFTYPDNDKDIAAAEQIFVDYVTPVRFYEKLHAMKNKQRLWEGDRSHKEIVALDDTPFSYEGFQDDKQEFLDRHTGDCTLFQLGITCEFLFRKMQKKQEIHEDRASVAILKSLDDFSFTYEGWLHDKQIAEGYYTDFSNLDRFHAKVVAMKNKQRLLADGDRSHPDIVALDHIDFSYKGWKEDKEECEKRHTGDCTVLQLGTFHTLLKKMKKKQGLFENPSCAQSIPFLVDMDVSNNNNRKAGVESNAEGGDGNATAPDKKCVVCLEREPAYAFIPCGHLCVCTGCIPHFDTNSSRCACPMCRRKALTVTRIYR